MLGGYDLPNVPEMLSINYFFAIYIGPNVTADHLLFGNDYDSYLLLLSRVMFIIILVTGIDHHQYH